MINRLPTEHTFLGIYKGAESAYMGCVRDLKSIVHSVTSFTAEKELLPSNKRDCNGVRLSVGFWDSVLELERAALPDRGITMNYYRIEHGAFFDTRLQAETGAGVLHVKGDARSADLLRRLAANGATDARAIEVSAEDYRAAALKAFPQLA